jgi:hypothetical protein
MAVIPGLLITVAGGAATTLVCSELKAWLPFVVDKLICAAGSGVKDDQLRSRLDEEWRSHVNDVPGSAAKIYVALGFIVAARSLSKNQVKSRRKQVQAKYDAQTPEGRKARRRYYLGKQLWLDNHRRAQEIMGEWGIFPGDDPKEVIRVLSPIFGDTLLMTGSQRKVIWNGLDVVRRAALVDVVRAERIDDVAAPYMAEYKQIEVARAKKRLAEAKDAIKSLDGLERLW